MSAKKRITRKELLKKPDEFITTTQRIIEYVQHDTKTVYSAAIAVACVLAVVGIFYLYISEQRQEAVTWEREALDTYYQSVDATDNVNESRCKAAIDKFRRLIDEHGSSSQAERAALYVGDAYYRLKNYAKAQEAYKAYLEKYHPQGTFRYLALDSQGQIEEIQGRYAQAMDYYQQSAQGSSVTQQVQAKLDIGRCYELLAKRELAKQTYQEALNMLKDKPAYRQLISKLKLNISTLEGQPSAVVKAAS